MSTDQVLPVLTRFAWTNVESFHNFLKSEMNETCDEGNSAEHVHSVAWTKIIFQYILI